MLFYTIGNDSLILLIFILDTIPYSNIEFYSFLSSYLHSYYYFSIVTVGPVAYFCNAFSSSSMPQPGPSGTLAVPPL